VTSPQPTPQARFDSLRTSDPTPEVPCRCLRCGYLLGALELETVLAGDGAATLRYRRTVFTEEIVPRPAPNTATGLPAFGLRNRVRLGRGTSARRREPGHRGDSFWAAVIGPAYVYCPERHCGLGQVVDPANAEPPGSRRQVPLR
jgi:hypothetical protein